LFLRIDARVLFYFLYGEGQFPGAVEDLKKFFVAHGVEGVLCAVGQESTDFFEESLLHHGIHAAVDAVEEVGTFTAQSHLDDAEGARFAGGSAETGEGAPCLVADFQGVDDAFGVAEIDGSIVFRVEEAQFGGEGSEAFCLIALPQVVAHLGFHGGDVIDAVAHGIDIHHAAAGEDEGIVCVEKVFTEVEDLSLIACSAVIVSDVQRSDKVMTDARQLFCGGCGGADAQVAVELAAVGIEDGGTDGLGEGEGEFRLSDGGGSEEDKEGLFAIGETDGHTAVGRGGCTHLFFGEVEAFKVQLFDVKEFIVGGFHFVILGICQRGGIELCQDVFAGGFLRDSLLDHKWRRCAVATATMWLVDMLAIGDSCDL